MIIGDIIGDIIGIFSLQYKLVLCYNNKQSCEELSNYYLGKGILGEIDILKK